MSDFTLGRRELLKTAAAITAGFGLATNGRAGPAAAHDVCIEEPFHGAVLNRRHGREVEGGLKIRVTGHAPENQPVTVNGIEAKRSGKRFEAEITLRNPENDITAVLRTSGSPAEHRIRVVWDRYSFPRYRFSIDDNSFFLRDVAQRKYSSLFECFYLKTLRDLHKKYGAKFVLNIYYTTDDGFDITQFPDRYKGEWKDNADWLRLAFHARANLPDRPYEDAPPEKLIADLDQVAEQIHRFAGPQTYTPPTVIHWGMVRPSAYKPLASRGIRALSGYFMLRPNGKYDVSYRMDNQRCEYLTKHDALKDFDSGIVFSHIDIVCNGTPIDRIMPTLEPYSKDANTAEIMDLFTHEQYFWPFYVNYVPDHAQRLDTALKWVTEHGYKPVFFHEGLLGAPDHA